MLTIDLTQSEFNLAKYHATRAEIGGVSRVRDLRDRQASIGEDQLIGQLGNIAIHKYLHGHSQQYALGRYMQNKFPRSGDSGEDVLGMNLDVKTSLMRQSDNFYSYHLPVRPHEMHPNWVYVLALVKPDYETTWNVFLMGWASSNRFGAPEESGVFKGAHILRADKLVELPPIRYNWF